MGESVTNEALSVILEQLCDQARNCVQAAPVAGEFGAAKFGAAKFRAGEFRAGEVDVLEFRAAQAQAPGFAATEFEPPELEPPEFEMDRVADARRASGAAARAGVDQLLRSLDDVRDLLSGGAPAPAAIEEFDLDRSAGEIIEALNLTSGLGRDHMVLESRPGPLLVTQDRKAMEQLLTRILDAAFKLARSSGVGVRLGAGGGEHSASADQDARGDQDPRGGQVNARGGQERAADPQNPRLSINVRDADLASRLTKWLNGNSGQPDFEDPGAISLALAVMVAGKRLRALGGAAELESASSVGSAGVDSAGIDSAGNCVVALHLPSVVPCLSHAPASGHRGQPEALQVLVAEDSDESFLLTAQRLRQERVWRARDGGEALAMIRKQRFDFILMDIHMPGMDGYSAIRGIRDWETQTGNARTPIVVLSADELETQRRSAAQCGCSGFLRKPLRQTDLTILVDRLKQVRIPAA
jgi:CheY-like chemotaxis protein